MKHRCAELEERAPRRAGLLPICRISRQHAAQWWAASEPACYLSQLSPDLYDLLDHFFVAGELFFPLSHACLRAEALHALCELKRLDNCEWHARLPCLNQVNRINGTARQYVFTARVERSAVVGMPPRLTIGTDDREAPCMGRLFNAILRQFTEPAEVSLRCGRIYFEHIHSRKSCKTIVAWLRDAGLHVEQGWTDLE